MTGIQNGSRALEYVERSLGQEARVCSPSRLGFTKTIEC